MHTQYTKRMKIKNLQWYQRIAEGNRNENTPCGITEGHLILMGIGSRETYIQMLDYGKYSVHTVCPGCFETDAHGNLLILPAWKSDLACLVNEAHQRKNASGSAVESPSL